MSRFFSLHPKAENGEILWFFVNFMHRIRQNPGKNGEFFLTLTRVYDNMIFAVTMGK